MVFYSSTDPARTCSGTEIKAKSCSEVRRIRSSPAVDTLIANTTSQSTFSSAIARSSAGANSVAMAAPATRHTAPSVKNMENNSVGDVQYWLEETKPQQWRQRVGYLNVHAGADYTRIPGSFSVCSWNCSSVNNNPFEYFVQHDTEPEYARLMTAVDIFLAEPSADAPLHTIFTDAMYSQLVAKLEAAGVDAVAIASVSSLWSSIRERKMITEFLKDHGISKKRLVSMPDRVCNTIRTVDGGRALRPAVINAYVDDALASPETWWAAWLEFMFDTDIQPAGTDCPKRVYEMLQPIKRAKYPAIDPEEEAVSLPLQTVFLAAFDAIMLHIVSHCAAESWLRVKRSLTTALVNGKDDRVIAVIRDNYSQMDAICLQEVSAVLCEALRKELGDTYHILAPADASALRNQNSIVLLKQATFPDSGHEITTEVLSILPDHTLSPGDLCVIKCADQSGTDFVIASFHGDSDGKATLPTIEAVVQATSSVAPAAKLLCGMDLNTTTPETAKRDHKLCWMEMLAALPKHNLMTSFGANPPPTDYTSFVARSSLQGQLHKAVPYANIFKAASKEPKDVILFRPSEFDRLKCWKDCTGDGAWAADTIMPSTKFPSDHAILAAIFSPCVAPK